jgi:hypothetical protein
MSLCFLQALAEVKRRESSVTEPEYIERLVAHLRGIRHPEDDIASVGDTLAAIEPWAGSLREIALTSAYGQLQGKQITYSARSAFLHQPSSRHISIRINFSRCPSRRYVQF